MPVEIVTVPCLSDNYAFVVHDDATGETAVVDVPEAAPIAAILKQREWTLSQVWLTHHHWDHVDGLAELLADHPARVVGATADAHRLPPLDHAVTPGDTFDFAGHAVHVIDVPGHTVGHIALHLPDADAVFTADSLMALGCGRLFEGTADQMWGSMQRLMALPRDTVVYSGHEYTAANARFALTIDPENSALISRSQDIEAARAAQTPTVPSTLALELETNPFLRAADPHIRAHLGLADASDAQVFAEIRARKDAF